MSKPSPAQLEVLRYMVRENISYIDFHRGDVGTEGRGSGYFFNALHKEDTPKITRSIVRGLINNGYLKYEDGGGKITERGRGVGGTSF